MRSNVRLRSLVFFYSSILALAVILLSNCIPAVAQTCPRIHGLVDINCDGRLKLLFVGDSITYGVRAASADEIDLLWGFVGRLRTKYLPAHTYPMLEIVRVAEPGITIRGLRRLLKLKRKQAIIAASDYAVILIGTNNFHSGTRSPSGMLSAIARIVRVLRSEGALVSVAPLLRSTREPQARFITAFNKHLLSHLSPTVPYGLPRFDRITPSGNIGADGVHPTAEGYDQMARLTAKFLLQDLQDLISTCELDSWSAAACCQSTARKK